MKALEEFAQQLNTLRVHSNFRQTQFCPPETMHHEHHTDTPIINFASNDYLALAQDPSIVAALCRGAETWGVGSGASALLGGHFPVHSQLETRFCHWIHAPAARLFGDGFLANLGVITALLSRHDIIFIDKLAHASLNLGAQLSRATLRRFRHNDLAHLEQLLAQSSSTHTKKLIAVDTVYSMDGDKAPLKKLMELANKYEAFLYIDEAHAFGILGNGRGAAWSQGIVSKDYFPSNLILMVTLGKAAGVSGALVAAHATLIDWFNQAAASAIYTTAPSPALAEALLQSFDLIENDHARRKKLFENIAHFRREIAHTSLTVLPSTTPIQAIILGDESRTLAAANQLREQGFFVPAIRPPTVPNGGARLRISLSCAHAEHEISSLINHLSSICSTR